MTNQWTSGYPTETGYYWVFIKDIATIKPVVAYVHQDQFYLILVKGKYAIQAIEKYIKIEVPSY
jgi:hypothetical protein